MLVLRHGNKLLCELYQSSAVVIGKKKDYPDKRKRISLKGCTFAERR